MIQETEEPHNAPGAVSLPGPARGGIVFRDVSFEYIPGVPVLDNISLDIPARHTVALVGPTGVGKSTLVSLIPRFYDVTSGQILLDGRDIRELTMDSLRQQISIVLQDVFLFYGTVRENLLFGRPDATEAEMMAAAQTANAHEFILDLPEGYDTMIGERGVKLSGGQKQRLSVARAVLKNAPILILDEATSSVDTANRTAHPGSARTPDAGTHNDRHCPPSLHHPPGGQDRGARGEQDPRNGHARGIR